jgi:hypothetical protein
MEDRVVVKKPPKSPALAGILAFFFPFGVGALYNNQIRKALVFFLVFAGLVTIQTTGQGQPFWGLMLAGFIIYQIFDSIQTSNNINRRVLQEEEEAVEVEEIPDFMKTGSIFWGIILMALGAIFLLANFEILDYDVIFKFWPVAVIIIGVKLVVDYAAKKNNKIES